MVRWIARIWPATRAAGWICDVLTAALAQLERAQEAAAELAEIMRLNPDLSADSFANYTWREVDREHLFDGPHQAGLPE